jgi:hypothetical protein
MQRNCSEGPCPFPTANPPRTSKDCLPFGKSGVSLRAWRWEWGVAFLGAGSGETSFFSRGSSYQQGLHLTSEPLIAEEEEV